MPLPVHVQAGSGEVCNSPDRCASLVQQGHCEHSNAMAWRRTCTVAVARHTWQESKGSETAASRHERSRSTASPLIRPPHSKGRRIYSVDLAVMRVCL
mmetsp:Transcript_16436/g.51645  ORF Transcript_16436/g.51645 Transcript_16436/m.51645 type:complete len:98 (+) Transcript_16436:2064-2357(+)